jgi:hypothetical protein
MKICILVLAAVGFCSSRNNKIVKESQIQPPFLLKGLQVLPDGEKNCGEILIKSFLSNMANLFITRKKLAKWPES